MAVKEGNERLMITMDQATKEKLLFLCEFFGVSKTKCLNKLIVFMYEKFK